MSTVKETSPDAGRRRKRGVQDGVFLKRGSWWIDYYDADGRRHRQKASPDYQIAKQIYRETMTRITKGEVTGIRDAGLTFRDFALKTWFPLVSARLAPAWNTSVRHMLEAQLLPVFGAQSLADLTRQKIETWAAARARQVGPSAFNKNVWILRNLLALARERGYLRTNPADNVKRRKEPSGRVRYLQPGEREVLLAHANANLWAYLFLALESGARRSELCRLHWSDVDMRQKQVTLKNKKNGDDRHVPMTSALYDYLHSLPRALDPGAPVLPVYDAPISITRAFNRLVKRTKLVNLTFHDLRHDFASRLAMAGVPLKTIGTLLGHRSVAMTQKYAHLSPDHLREAMKALEPGRAAVERAG